MVYKLSPDAKSKPRGKPFPKNNVFGKPKNTISDPARHTISNEGAVVAPLSNSEVLEPKNEGILHKLPGLVMDALDKHLEECMETTQNEEVECAEKPQKDLEALLPLALLETMDFKNGENKLSIRFSKKNNRMFRIQIFLNDEDEIRPVTYNGSSTAYGFWNLLKKSLRK